MSNQLIKISAIINEISMGPFGSDIKVENFVNDGVPVLNGSNLTGVKLSENSFKYVTSEKAVSFKKAIAKRGDIVITHRGTLGQISYIPDKSKFNEYVISQSQFRVALNRTLVDPAFFVYYFHTSEGQRRLLANKCHVGVPALAQATTNFKLIEIPLPTLTIQQKIASVLSTLDAKIELNNRINAELEAMAKTLYNYWFVQFDFPDKHGRPYKSSGGKMVWNEALKREIPEGWEVKKLGKAIKIVRGASPRPIDDFLAESGKPWVKISDATKTNNRFIVETKQFIRKEGILNSRSVFPNTLILSNSASPAIPRIMKIEACVHDGWLIIDDYSGGLTPEFMFHYFEYERPRIIYLGTGSIFKNLKTDYLKDLKFIMPPKSILDKITPQFKNISESIFLRTKQNQTLASLRDWLLPMLMNGQVRVEAIEEKVLAMAAEPAVEYGKEN